MPSTGQPTLHLRALQSTEGSNVQTAQSHMHTSLHSPQPQLISAGGASSMLGERSRSTATDHFWNPAQQTMSIKVLIGPFADCLLLGNVWSIRKADSTTWACNELVPVALTFQPCRPPGTEPV